MDVVSFAISPCPNDVTIFGALLLGRVALPGVRTEFAFEDVETLNEAALAGAYDVVKISAAMAAPLADAYAVLPSGAAFGFGAGPKLVVKQGFAGRPRSVAVPGLRTTAATLLRAALAADDPGLPPPDAAFVPVRYDAIVEAVQSGRTEAGLLIHETALAAASHGLELVLDLGAWWQARIPDSPVPLGVIVAKKSLGEKRLAALGQVLRQSLAMARAEPELVAPLVRLFARERDEAVIAAHIRAYVGDLSLDMGPAGRTALAELAQMAPARHFKALPPLPAQDDCW
ncbi:MqnA/MqnD/SBP family protein [Desulfovibrio sp. TomC]|uniref:MqnA/MqnD/SBP family protein n=1 Tax=Desulfovibrio sp. TomC TaxID=1562888 RepID=UPI000574929E|nr:MqnA/MqnD/SBP family protein [Desulfovibrio sp. TomC]KHK03859.1 Menaquinone via futalosine step 4 [Desulfovibrio sp. TomC]